MKYNPKINEDMARLPGFAFSHPLQDQELSQGNLILMYQLQEWLKEIGGFAGVSLQPAAGAHGELTGLLIIQAYHRDRGDLKRNKILVPDSAHGTNPASTTMAGMDVIELPSDARGNIDLEKLRQVCDDTVAGVMITNPIRLVCLRSTVLEVAEQVHALWWVDVWRWGQHECSAWVSCARVILVSMYCITTFTRPSLRLMEVVVLDLARWGE